MEFVSTKNNVFTGCESRTGKKSGKPYMELRVNDADTGRQQRFIVTDEKLMSVYSGIPLYSPVKLEIDFYQDYKGENKIWLKGMEPIKK